jgi:membrane protein
VSAAGGHSGTLSPRRRRRLWSALIGSALLLAGFNRRSAETHPTDVPVAAPAKGRTGVQARAKARRAWLEILRLLYSAIGQHRVVSIAAGVTFFVLLAIFPAIAALVSVYGLFADPNTIRMHLDELSTLLPSGAIEIVGDQLNRVASGGTSTLGATFLFTLGLSLWSANAGMKALCDALNIVYDAEERRGLIKLNAVSLAFTAGALLVLLLALGAIVVLPAVMNYLGLESIGGTLIMLARWPALYMLVVLALAIIYRFGPDREHAQWHWITWGSALAALAWITASILFSWYAENFGSYNKTYGSLGAAVGFMTWIWISNMVILGGAEIDALLERLDRGTAK